MVCAKTTSKADQGFPFADVVMFVHPTNHDV